MDLDRITDYLPKKSVDTLTVKALELKLVMDAKAEKTRLRQEQAAIDGIHKE